MKGPHLFAGLVLASLLAAGCGSDQSATALRDAGERGAAPGESHPDAARMQALQDLKNEIAALHAAQGKDTLDIRLRYQQSADFIRMNNKRYGAALAESTLREGEREILRQEGEWEAKRTAARLRFIEKWGEHPDVRRGP